MDGQEVRQRMLDLHGVRVEPEMSEYVARRLAEAGASLASLPIIGGDARTGMPVRMWLDAAKFLQPSA